MNLRLDHPAMATTYAVVLLGGCAALHMVYNLTLPIYGDEAYYWVWGQNLQLGYYDHPPMVAYVNALFTLLFGKTLFAVRLATVTCLSLAAIYMYALSAKIFNSRTALLTLLLFVVTPAANLGYSLHTIDSPLLLFWSMALYYGYDAVRHNTWRHYLFTGAALGAALLSKYTAILFPGCWGLFVLCTAPRALLHGKAWCALGLAVLIFSPVLVYNAQHGFASFLYQYTHGSAAGFTPRLDTFGTFFLGQFVVMSPIFMGVLLAVGCRYRFWWGDTGRTYLMGSFAFPLLFFLYKALFKTMELNWGVVAFVGGTPLLAHFLITYRLKKLTIAGLGLALLIDLAMKFPLLFGLTGTWNYHNGIAGYDDMARRVFTHRTPGDVLFADRHTRASILWFYAQERVYIPTPVRFSEYTLWDQALDFSAMRGIYVAPQNQESALQKVFPTVQLLEKFAVHKAGYIPKEFYIYRVGPRT